MVGGTIKSVFIMSPFWSCNDPNSEQKVQRRIQTNLAAKDEYKTDMENDNHYIKHRVGFWFL